MMPLHSKQTSRASKRRQSGVSMIELLVSMVIFAFGMLGLVGLQTKTLAYGQSGLYRSQATALTDDILDRMRTDRANAKAGVVWITDFANLSSSFTGTTIAQTDLKEWKQQVEALLPAGAAKIEADTVNPGYFIITIRWNETRAGGSSTEQFVTRTRL
jgi:type IV pilus assembly protein PilV